MNIKIILKGYVTKDGELELLNSRQTKNKLNQNFKYKKQIIIKIHTNETELSLQEMVRKRKAKMFIADVNIYVTVEDGKIVFKINEKDLEKYYKKYRKQYICVIVEIKDSNS